MTDENLTLTTLHHTCIVPGPSNNEDVQRHWHGVKTPGTLMTSIPEGHDEPMTIDIGGEKVPVMTQAELDPLLTHKVDLSKYQWKYTKPVDVWMTVGKTARSNRGGPVFSGSSTTPTVQCPNVFFVPSLVVSQFKIFPRMTVARNLPYCFHHHALGTATLGFR